MLETLVSSRIRRTLLEHILRYPEQRFYLRGVAKELGLTVSPVRRELKRLEELRVLKAYQEANIRFYIVDQTSPVFLQLRQAAMPAVAEDRGPAPAVATAAPLEPMVASTVITPRAIERIRKASPSTPRWLAWTGIVGFGMTAAALVLAVYVATMREQRRPMSVEYRLQPQAAALQVKTEQVNVTGEMRGHRWKLMPGAVGGFSAANGVER
jgi:DNA-binding Lrp family transcriptional regulator